MDYLNQEKLIRSYVFDYYLKESKKRPVVSQVLFCVYSLKTDIRVKDIKTEPTRIPQKIRDLLSFKK
jgi:hypothetical protein